MRLFFHKLTHWEYWPFKLVYIPIYFVWAYYAFRARTLFFFNAANPSIRNGGFMSESKKEIYDLIPQQYYPKTVLVASGSDADEVVANISRSISYPMILKPDIGLRGSAVKKITSDAGLRQYHAKADFDYLAQELIPYENEVGIFYVRYPQQKRGRITGIVAKEFLIVEGDGRSTLEMLLKKDPRHAMQLGGIRRELGERINEVIPKGQKLNVVPYGNHARGAKFIDASRLISEKLTDTINHICLQIPEFYFGRLDIMYRTFEQLEAGEDFMLVEVNGTSSEPTHIYDPKHSLFFAWKELARHIRYMYEIGAENHRRGIAYLSKREGMEQYRIHLRQSRKITDF